jgi:parallel beta-helix repeat protein
MPNVEVVFTSTIGKLDSYTAVTNAMGQATVRITSTQSGVATVIGVAPPVQNSTTLRFYYVPSTILLVHSIAEPCSNTTSITATVLDQKGNRISEMDVSFSHNATGIAAFNPEYTFTNQAGEASTAFSDTKLHMERVRVNATVYAPDLGITLKNSTILDYTPSSILLNSTRYPPVCGKNFLVTAHLEDRYGNVVCGYSVDFYHNATGLASFTPPSNKTNSSGDATSIFSDDKIEDVRLEGRISIPPSGLSLSNYTTAQYGAPIFLSGEVAIDQELVCEDVEVHIVDGWLKILEGGKLTLKGVNLTFDVTPNIPGSPPYGIYLEGQLYVTDSNGVRSNLTVNTTMEDCCAGEPECCSEYPRPPGCDAGDSPAPCYGCYVKCNYGQPRFVFEALDGSTLIMNNTDLEYLGTYGMGVWYPNEVGLYVAGDNAIVKNITISNNRDYCLILHGNNANVINNTFTNCFVGVFIWQNANNSRISQNQIYNCSRYGIQIDDYGDNNLIQYNNIYNNGDGIFVSNTKTNNVVISNNIRNNSGTGVYVYQQRFINLLSNQITGNPNYGVYCEPSTPQADAYFLNNNITNNGVNCDGCPSCPPLPMSTCGTITKNTILTADLVNDSTCITFGADNITLDCAGHSISWCCAGWPGEYSAIYAEGRKNIEIKNCVIKGYPGSVAGYTHAIYLKSTNNSRVDNNTIYNFTYQFLNPGSLAGVILLDGSSQNLIYNNTIFNTTSNPIWLAYSSNNCSVYNNNIYDVVASIFLYQANSNRVLRNGINRASAGVLLSNAFNSVVELNNISNSVRGIDLLSSSNNLITSNRLYNISSYSAGMPLYEGAVHVWSGSLDNVVRNNTIYNTTFYGMEITDDSHRNFLFNNTITKAFAGANISTENVTLANTTIYDVTYGVYLNQPYNASVVNNTIRNNAYGVYCMYASTGSIRNNTISSNSNTGIYFEECAVDVSSNRILSNTLYGVNCNTAFWKPTFSSNTVSGNGNNCDACTGCPG